ncbi:hypothetical protein BJ912DRAFT_865117, partial [Pholiota molesta]
NVVEWIFGVLKKCWAILVCPPQFLMLIQAKVLPALAAVHNFIMDYDPTDINEYLNDNEDDLNPNPGQPRTNEFGTLANEAVTLAEKTRATLKRDSIAQAMWDDYQRVLWMRE